ncbi:hypothetical protein J6590_023745 [Homalodisca vitripennis]|nr:hypothetical protein J6590_023745 [Homalodisca vitripennis]
MMIAQFEESRKDVRPTLGVNQRDGILSFFLAVYRAGNSSPSQKPGRDRSVPQPGEEGRTSVIKDRSSLIAEMAATTAPASLCLTSL